MGRETTSKWMMPDLQSKVVPTTPGAAMIPVFWIYMDGEGHWCLHKEGGAAEASFNSRAAAIAFVGSFAGTSPYRLFVETDDRRMVQQHHGAFSIPEGEPKEDSTSRALIGSTVSDAANARAESSELSRRLEWANHLASASRVSPSRMALLGIGSTKFGS